MPTTPRRSNVRTHTLETGLPNGSRAVAVAAKHLRSGGMCSDSPPLTSPPRPRSQGSLHESLRPAATGQRPTRSRQLRYVTPQLNILPDQGRAAKKKSLLQVAPLETGQGSVSGLPSIQEGKDRRNSLRLDDIAAGQEFNNNSSISRERPDSTCIAAWRMETKDNASHALRSLKGRNCLLWIVVVCR